MSLKEKIITRLVIMFRFLKIVCVRYNDEKYDCCNFWDGGNGRLRLIFHYGLFEWTPPP